MSKTVKWILGILLILLLSAVVFLIIQEMNKSDEQAAQPGGTSGGIASIINQYLPLVSGWVKGLFGNKGPDVVDCDPNNPGYEKDGSYNPNCNIDYTNCDPDKCNPLRSGWNQCGFPDNKC